MNALFILNEITTNGYNIVLLDLISLFSIICGILVIISKNPIVSVLFLIGLFFSLASYLIVLGISFIGLSYLLVYVGAVSILFLFILMLINVRISELLSNTSNVIPLAILTGMYLIYTVYPLLPNNHIALYVNAKTILLLWPLGYLYDSINNSLNYSIVEFTAQDKDPIMFVTAAMWDGNLSETTHITSIGNIMYTSYSIWLIITSIILLLAMVGSIVITIKQKA